MSAQALTTLTIFLALLGGLALGWYGRKWSGVEATAYDRGHADAERRLADDVEGTERRVYRHAAIEAQAIIDRLTKKRRSIPANAIVRRLSDLAHPMLVSTPVPSVTGGSVVTRTAHFTAPSLTPANLPDLGEGEE